ncbi:MAG: tRNA 2-thiouridine(34) synthase MnmA [Candidatus Omnitrophica bacterium]|nr:tRNA 2-thiouridine(34) synthase MnmA [Candidatus Omnitrophota bacterium]
MGKRVLVAMSGGVDSAVSAYLLKDDGYEIIGATIKFWSKEICGFDTPRACCNLKSIEDCRLIAERIKIPYYVFNLEKEFKKEVIDYFIEEYLRGHTPNPCIVCNEKIKWGYFLKKAKEIGADFIATGHYAQVVYSKEEKRFLLKEASDKEKDQSYVLFSLNQNLLAQTIFPLGNYKKSAVRNLAKRIGLPVYDKRESQDICFIPGRDKKEFFKKFIPEIKPGPILNKEGKVLGEHKGIVFYTLGQREGLGISGQKPLYVIKIDAQNNALIVGDKKEAMSQRLEAKNLNWIVDKPEGELNLEVRIRYRHPKSPAVVISQKDNSVEVVFQTPQFAVTPGQAVVFYKDDLVLGGGWIV